MIGINPAIISPSGGSIGIGFAVPSKIAVAVIDQLQKYGETRRGWLGVRIQQVTDEIADSLGIKPARGALIAGIDDKGPAKPAGIEAGDVVVKFDGQDIREMRDLPRIVADTPVGKDVEVIVIRKGKEETKTVKLGRLEDGEKAQQASLTPKKDEPAEKSVTQKALGLNLANHQGRGHHRRRRQFAGRRQAVAGGLRGGGIATAGGVDRGRLPVAHRAAEEGRQEDRGAADRQS